jgi:hypothetical protein
MPKNSAFDIDRRGTFQGDLKYGKEGQEYVENIIIEGLVKGTTEVKRDSKFIQTKNLYIEEQQNPLNRGYWCPSGVNVTKADVWVHIIADELIICTSVRLLKKAIKIGENKNRQRTYCRSDNPTKGILLKLEDLFEVCV